MRAERITHELATGRVPSGLDPNYLVPSFPGFHAFVDPREKAMGELPKVFSIAHPAILL